MLLALVFIAGGYVMRDRLSPLLTKHYFKHPSTLIRAENYVFAGTIWIKKPVFGIGLHVPLAPHLENYEPKIYNEISKFPGYPNFSEYIKDKKTLENIVLCGFVEMGTLFSITYILLVAMILKKGFTHVKQNPEKIIMQR